MSSTNTAVDLVEQMASIKVEMNDEMLQRKENPVTNAQVSWHG